MEKVDSSFSSDGEASSQPASSSLAAIAENLQRSAIESARTVQHSSSTHFSAFQSICSSLVSPGHLPAMLTLTFTSIATITTTTASIASTMFTAVAYTSIFQSLPVLMSTPPLLHGLLTAKEYPALGAGLSISAALLAMRVHSDKHHGVASTENKEGNLNLVAPRRYLFRHTLGRFQSEEARYARTEKNVKDLNLSVDLLKKESVKLLQRAALAEKEMKYGHTELVSAGTQFQRLAKSAYKVESRAADLLDKLRYIPSRESLALRAEARHLLCVASMASTLNRQRSALNKRIVKINELGVPV
ncbi:hypothetical protein Fmac_005929 [Flemingia macrophylla]|uniref:Uncharacterized protein n=1 Tax=Flemingia macrophylla TaxID=520843 RepID=A0ABD1N981_9FABA